MNLKKKKEEFFKVKDLKKDEILEIDVLLKSLKNGYGIEEEKWRIVDIYKEWKWIEQTIKEEVEKERIETEKWKEKFDQLYRENAKRDFKEKSKAFWGPSYDDDLD